MKELTNFGKSVLKDRYLLEGETPLDLFTRVAKSYSSDENHFNRMLKYITNFWFMPATPVLSNGGTSRGFPISCYLNSVQDDLNSIADKWNENIFIASNGGGIGTNWSNVRGIGDKVKANGQSSGVIPFVKVMDSMTLAISQGNLRRGSSACYLHISHPEIEEFLEIRKPTGDFNRKSLNIHHGVVIPDSFMECLKSDKEWELISPKTKKVVKTVNARQLFEQLLETRVATGEPYIIYEDNVNDNLCESHGKLGLKVSQSNLCTEIMLPTGVDHKGKDRTAVCCLGSVNLEYYDEWKNDDIFIEDCLRFLDNVLNDFLNKTKNIPELKKARYSVERERSVGLGAMGFHSYLQKNDIAFESLAAMLANSSMFKHIYLKCDEANYNLGEELGPCPDSIDAGVNHRFSCTQAIAPTASISIICGGTSPCIEPINANIYTHKTLSGSFEVKNKYLERLLTSLDKNTKETWDSILENEGSVEHLGFLTSEQKEVFKTAFEIDQRFVIEFAESRTPFIDQGQSVNLFLPPNIDKYDLLQLHYQAWKRGIKSLYYLRSKSIQRAGFAGGVESDNKLKKDKFITSAENRVDYEECLACQ